MTTLKQVAECAGVSQTTASRVLGNTKTSLRVAEKTRQRVREVAERLGYRVNYHMQAMATGRTLATGFISGWVKSGQVHWGANDLYFESLRRGLEFAMQDAGTGDSGGAVLISVQSKEGADPLEQGARYIAERRIDALVLTCSTHQIAASVEANPDLPLVVVDPAMEIRRPRICFDASIGLRKSIEHLKELGHRDVLWFGQETNAEIIAQRQRYFIETAWNAGMRGASCLQNIDDLGSEYLGEQLLQRAQDAMSRKLAEPGRTWTAVVAYNDQWAMAACRALRKAGLDVPGDVSVVGFDNLIAEFCIPGLTTVDHRLYEMGQRAGVLATRLIEADEEERLALRDYCEEIEPIFIVRESTGPVALPRPVL